MQVNSVFLQLHGNETEIRIKQAASIQEETPGQPEDTLER